MEAENRPRKKKSREYCSENAEVSGGNFLISYEEDNAEREREREREGGTKKMKRKIGKKRGGEVKK